MNGAQLFWARRVRVFDLDGTLVDTLPDLLRCLNAALADLALPDAAAATVRRSLHGGLEGTAHAALLDLQAPPGLAPVLAAQYRLHYEAEPARASRPYDGVADLLQRLRARGEALAVCTNKPAMLARRVLRSAGLDAFVDAVVGADTCLHRKPHPLPLQHALRLLGETGRQALMVGDSAVDRDCAQAAGVDCLIFSGGYGAEHAAGPPVFDHYRALLASEPHDSGWARD